MAFEIPLEADQVDDLNLFSTLVRAPVIGTLLWIFGSQSKGQNQNGDEDVREPCIDDNLCDDESDARNQSSATKGVCKTRQHGQSLKKAAPSLIGSEISEAELVDSLDAVSLYGYSGTYSSNYTSGAPKKELSWSDDVGKNLVVYEAEVRARHLYFRRCATDRPQKLHVFSFVFVHDTHLSELHSLETSPVPLLKRRIDHHDHPSNHRTPNDSDHSSIFWTNCIGSRIFVPKKDIVMPPPAELEICSSLHVTPLDS